MAKNKRPPPIQKSPARTQKITEEDETRIEQAKLDYNAHQYKSISAAAKAHGVLMLPEMFEMTISYLSLRVAKLT